MSKYPFNQKTDLRFSMNFKQEFYNQPAEKRKVLLAMTATSMGIPIPGLQILDIDIQEKRGSIVVPNTLKSKNKEHECDIINENLKARNQ